MKVVETGILNLVKINKTIGAATWRYVKLSGAVSNPLLLSLSYETSPSKDIHEYREVPKNIADTQIHCFHQATYLFEVIKVPKV